MADKYSVLGWFSAVRKDASDEKSEILSRRLSLPSGFGKSPVPIDVNLDVDFRPLAQRDAELCMWIRTHWTSLDATSKDFLTARWLKSTAFRVSVRTRVKVKGNSYENVTASYTLAESFVKIAKSSDILYVVPAPSKDVVPDPDPEPESNTATPKPEAEAPKPEENQTENQIEPATTEPAKIIDREAVAAVA